MRCSTVQYSSTANSRFGDLPVVMGMAWYVGRGRVISWAQFFRGLSSGKQCPSELRHLRELLCDCDSVPVASFSLVRSCLNIIIFHRLYKTEDHKSTKRKSFLYCLGLWTIITMCLPLSNKTNKGFEVSPNAQPRQPCSSIELQGRMKGLLYGAIFRD